MPDTPIPAFCGPNDIWEVYPGSNPASLALPDYYSTYLSYTYDARDQRETGLRISGQFPSARYLSFNVYAMRKGTSMGALTDYQIMTPELITNPFIPGGKSGSYVVHVQREMETPPDPGLRNVLTYDLHENLADPQGGFVTVVLRYYVPQQDFYGGVPCPDIRGYDIGDPQRTDFDPPRAHRTPMVEHEGTFTTRLSPIFQTTLGGGDPLRFYHAAGGGQFNNADNLYLIAAVRDLNVADHAVILRVRALSYPVSNEQFDQTVVRYWSINQGNANTSTPYGMRDSQFRASKDGYVYILMGGGGAAGLAAEKGYNFMPWMAGGEEAVILYRNMLTVPQYRYSITRVPKLPPPNDDPTQPPWSDETLAQYEAQQFLGANAPRGRKVSLADFQSNSGGMASPGFA